MKSESETSAESKPSLALSLLIFVVSVGAMGFLRLYVFGHYFIALTYGLPLLLCLWHQDRRLLWSMAAVFVGMSWAKAVYLLPNPDLNDHLELYQWVMQVANIVVVAGVVHIVINLTQRLRRQNAHLMAANTALAAREEEIGRQNQELQAQSEELSQQNQELQQQHEELARHNEEFQTQAEELEQQSEELQAQAEELQTANQELNHREALLQTILASLRQVSDERQLMERVCDALKSLLGESIAAAALVEREGDQLVVRTQSGIAALVRDRWPFSNSFASVIMDSGQTGYVEDLANRPDLIIPEAKCQAFSSILATPVRVNGQPAGSVEAYSIQPRHWTKQDFAIIEWVAAQCSIALESLRLQQELRRSEAQLRTTLENLDQGVVVSGLDGELLHWNRAALEMHGFTNLQECRRNLRSLTDTFQLTGMDGTVWSVEQWPLARILRGETVHDLEARVRRLDCGVERIYSYRGSLVRDVNRRPLMAVIGISDITERVNAEERLRQSEEQLRTAALAAEIGVWSWKPGTNQVVVSANWRKLFGVSAEANVTFESWRDALHPEDRQRAVAELNAATEQHGDFHTEYRIVRPDGSIRWVIDRGRATYDANGRAVGMAGVNVDITKRKQVEEQLQLARNELAQTNANLEKLVQERTAKLQEMVDELEHFSYTITHDMRAPLRAMQGFAGIMGELCGACMDQEKKDCLQRISTSAARMDRLITDALSYSRTLSQELPLAPVDPAALLKGMLHSYPAFQPPRAKIEIVGPLPTVLANEAGLTQCFSNLLGNAVKFVAPGKTPHVRIRAEFRAAGVEPPPHFHLVGTQEPEEGEDDEKTRKLPVLSSSSRQMVRFWFEDNGIGIPRVAQGRLFQMFQRASKDHEGTGIGLALVRKVTERMGGHVGFESEPGQGSRFWLELMPGDGQN